MTMLLYVKQSKHVMHPLPPDIHNIDCAFLGIRGMLVATTWVVCHRKWCTCADGKEEATSATYHFPPSVLLPVEHVQHVIPVQ